MTEQEADRIWTQEELREHLRGIGHTDFVPGEVIPQGVKYIASPQPPLTEKDLRHVDELIEEHPEWRLPK